MLRNACLLFVLVLLLLITGGCFQQYPGDPVPSPGAERKLPDGSTPRERNRPERARGDGR